MWKLSAFIVSKRNLIFLLYAILIVFSLFSRSWVNVESELDTYLPETSETRQALDIMDEQFTTFGSARIMFSTLTLDEAQTISDEMEAMPGVQSVDFDETKDHYSNASALYAVTFDYDEDDERCLTALDELLDAYADYDIFVSTDLGNAIADSLTSEVSVIMRYVAVIIVAVLILTSQTYAEVPVLILTFISAMLVNMGSNFLLGTISFVSNSVTNILQLALSLDYAVILCNRFKEERQSLDAEQAVTAALSKAIPEISASSLTTIGGLCAMMFMQFQIGPDLAVNLIKSILIALLTVFLLMPGLLVLFSPLMDKSNHRSFVPKVPFIGKFAYITRRVIPPVFLAVLVFAGVFSSSCPYAYGEDQIATPKQNDTQIAKQMIRETFSDSNLVALIIPAGDYEKEGALLAELEAMPEVKSATGLANVETDEDSGDGYVLTDALSPREFSEMADLDYELAALLYTAYATDQEAYGRIVGGIDSYKVSIMDMFVFVHDCVEDGYVDMDDEERADIDDAYEQIINAQAQLQGTEYSRLLVDLDLPLGDTATYPFLDTIRAAAQKHYPGGQVYVAGTATTEYDFQKSFDIDNIVVSVVTILIVLVVLLFTFKSVGMPLLLILVIQGSIWINFAVPRFTGESIFFMSYLVVTAIQMGANIDYAIVIGSRFTELKERMDKREAIIETMNFAFPTIITSGAIMASAGIMVGQMTSSPSIAGIGTIGRGTIISMLLVLFVLPQILLLGEKVIDRTSFSNRREKKKEGGGENEAE